MPSDALEARSPRNRIVSVSAFIDWNSQIHISGIPHEKDPIATARVVLKRTSQRIARCLQNVNPDTRFKVQLRLYHGWHKGYAPTPNKLAITTVLASQDYSDLSPTKNVIFEENVGYGDCLLFALPKRIHERLGIHLPNTLRMIERRLGEKMVDTAMAADVVATAAKEPNDWILVVAEDDDLIPPIFTAEALLSGHPSKILMLHSRDRSKNIIKLDNISVEKK